MQQPLQERTPHLARNPLLASTDASQETGTSVLYLLDFMQKVEVFQNLSEDELLQLAEAFTSQHAEDGEKLVQEGDEGSELFFIESGTVSVRKAEGNEERELTRLSQGQYFGETALVEKAPRNASVYAVGDVRLRVLTRDHFEMFDLHRKLHLELKHANVTNGLQELLGDLVTLRTFLKALALLGGYLLLAILLFSSLEGWSWVDCVYFAVITLMTVGYGDFAPKHWGSRLLLVFFVLMSLVIVATSIGEFLEGLAPDLGCLAALVTLLGISSGIARIAVQNCATWADALYFSVVTLSTIGYGDLTPLAEPGSRIVVGFLALLGVPVFGIVLAKIVEIAYGRAKSSSMPSVVGGLTNEKFDQLVDFTDKLWRGGGYNSHPQQSLREQITPFEFLCFILTQNETVSLDEIKLIMANFSELDLTKTGLLEQQDVDEWLQRGSCNPAGFKKSGRCCWQRAQELAPDPANSVGCTCLPSRCCPVVRRKLSGRRMLIRVGLVSALVSAVASAVVVRAAVGEAPAPVQQPSSCGVARNSTTSCVPWRLAGTHLVDQHTGELQMDLTDTLEECCEGCDALADCQAWIFERMAKRCRWIQFDDPVCRQDPGDLGCRCYTHWGTAYGFKPKSNLVWLTAT
eukprot:s2032_g25.t1